MPIFPIRGLAKFGVLTDPDPYDLPPTAWSMAVNARFRNGQVSRGPVFRNVLALGTASPRFCRGNKPTSGLDLLFIGYDDGSVTRYSDGTETAYSPAGFSPSNSESPWTNCHLADVVYLNRDDRIPWYLRSQDSTFQQLPVQQQSPVTISIASPGVVTWNSHGLTAGTPIVFTTTGALPTGLTAGFVSGAGAPGTLYQVQTAGLTTNTFQVAPIGGGSSVVTTGSQSGVQTCTANPGAWQSTTRAGLLASCGGALVALNVTLGAVNYPTMVLTSSFPTAGTTPGYWDSTNPATNATQNILAEMEGPIIDCCLLGQNLFIYGESEVWIMQPVGAGAIFDYSRVFTNRGAINANCTIEIGSKHYVFGIDDIYMHDGVSAVSLCNEKTRDFIFGGLNASKAYRCFVTHNAQLKELMFCYVSGDAYCNFLIAPDGCNRSATYNYETGTWTFDDLPLVYAGTRANLDTTMTYSSAGTTTYANIGGTYLSQEDTFRKNLVFVGDQNTTYNLTESLYAFDPYGPLSQVNDPVDTNATARMLLNRDGIDLDAVGADLRGYKLCRSIWPLGRLDMNAASLPQFTIGAADDYNDTVTFSAPMTWDDQLNFKLDFNIAGRYLFIQMLYNSYNNISLSGFDMDLDVLGER